MRNYSRIRAHTAVLVPPLALACATRLVEPAKIPHHRRHRVYARDGRLVSGLRADAGTADGCTADATHASRKARSQRRRHRGAQPVRQGQRRGSAPAAFDAPETHLRLTLEGVFQAEVPEESAAIVAEQGRPGELYLVGGKLPGNAMLTEVHADRIVLRRGTAFETLRFSDEPSIDRRQSRRRATAAEVYEARRQRGTEDAAPTPSRRGSAEVPPEEPPPVQPMCTPTPTASLIARVVQSYRERLQQDPAGTLNSLGVAPVSTSGAQGYRRRQPGRLSVSGADRPAGR